jgi:hypothetical protein
MQVRNAGHTRRSIALKERFETEKRSLGEGGNGFFKLFEESTFEGSRAVARKMKQFAKGQSRGNQEFLLFHSLLFLVRYYDSEMLSWPNSPLLVLLQFVDPNVLSGDEDAPLQGGETRVPPLNRLVDLVDPSNYSTYENQLILAKQLLKHAPTSTP